MLMDPTRPDSLASAPPSKVKKPKKKKKNPTHRVNGGEGGKDTVPGELNGQDDDVDSEEATRSSRPEKSISSTNSPKSDPERPPPSKSEAKDPTNSDAVTLSSDSASASLSVLESQIATLRAALFAEKAARAEESAETSERLVVLQTEKDYVNEQYNNLRERVSTIKFTLGQRLKDDAEELAASRRACEELDDSNRALNDTIAELKAQLSRLNDEAAASVQELSTLRNRLNLAQQNWVKERGDLEAEIRATHEVAERVRTERSEWEVIAVEEKAERDNLGEFVFELKDQCDTLKRAADMAVKEEERGREAVNGLQRAIAELQEARREELKETVESMQSQIDALNSKSLELAKRAKVAEEALDIAKRELEHALPFEKEVKEKNLLLGKLRHEAVTLNDHLRKALRMLKRDNADDKIDKQLITTFILQFVSIQRGDTKKYEVLQLIASVLNWTDEQREKAGLLRPGTASSVSSAAQSPMTPVNSPFHRSPSTPLFRDAYDGSRDIWASVLDSQKS